MQCALPSPDRGDHNHRVDSPAGIDRGPSRNTLSDQPGAVRIAAGFYHPRDSDPPARPGQTFGFRRQVDLRGTGSDPLAVPAEIRNVGPPSTLRYTGRIASPPAMADTMCGTVTGPVGISALVTRLM